MMKQRGTSLFEMIIVIALVAPLTIHILGGLIQARNSRNDAATSLAALQAVRERLDAARLELATSSGEPAALTTQSVSLRNNRMAVLTTTVRKDSATGLLRISVEAAFPQETAGLKPISLETLAQTQQLSGRVNP